MQLRVQFQIAVEELLRMGDFLETGALNIRDIVTFSEQAELTGQEDKADEYLAWTIEGIQNIHKHYRGAVKEWEKLRAEQKLLRGKKNRKLTRLKRKVARVRLDSEACDDDAWRERFLRHHQPSAFPN